MKCPHCGKEINPAAMLGSISTPAKAEAARENAKLGGWPKGKKRGKRSAWPGGGTTKLTHHGYENPERKRRSRTNRKRGPWLRAARG